MTTPGFNNPAYLVGQFGTPIWGVAGTLPFTGNYFWVDETNGSDGNTGGPSDAFKTLTQALSKCTSGNSDVIFMTGSVHVTTTLAWNLNKTHLIGLSPPSQNSRARIAIADTTLTTLVTPLVNVTGAGCWFQNIEVFHGNAATTGEVAWAEAGGENYYKNCNFIQTGNTINASEAASRALTIASGENLFEDCTIGGDTEQRNTNTNATLEFLSGAPRNVFKRCIFQSYNGLSTNIQVLIQAGGADRYAYFEQCMFHNFGTTMAVAVTNTSGGGPNADVVLNNCIVIGATAVATSGQVFVNQISAAGATTTYIGLLAT